MNNIPLTRLLLNTTLDDPNAESCQFQIVDARIDDPPFQVEYR